MTTKFINKETEGDAAQGMREHGVKRVPVDYFHVGGYRYTDMKDAIAQAKRIKKKS